MITAKEARAINQLSDSYITAWCEKLDPLIRDAADKGLYEIKPYFTDETPKYADEGAPKPQPSAPMKLLIKKLESLGYSVGWVQLSEYAVPKPSLGCMDDDDYSRRPKSANFGLKVMW